MKYNSKFYAKAFCQAALKSKDDGQLQKQIKNLLEVVKKNRDQNKLKEILLWTEKIISQKKNYRKILIESARPLEDSSVKLIDSFLRPKDIVAKKINPGLLAGIKITINDELQFDGSFSKKLKNLFA